MPQPLPENITNYTVEVGSAAFERPKLTILAAQIFSLWAQLEMTMAFLFASLIHGDPTPTAAVYNSIRNSGAQRDAFKALANVALRDPEDRDILDAILQKFAAAAKNRDVLAHQVWGTIPQLPEALLLVDSKGAAALRNRLGQLTASGMEMTNEHASEALQVLRDSISVWREPDFVAALGRIGSTAVLANALSIMLQNSQRPERDEKARQLLLADSEIAELVRRNAQRRKTNQQAPPQ